MHLLVAGPCCKIVLFHICLMPGGCLMCHDATSLQSKLACIFTLCAPVPCSHPLP